MPSPAICDGSSFINKIYYIDVDHIAGVSQFYRTIPDNYFEETLSFVDMSGQRKVVNTYFDDHELTLLKNNREAYISINENFANYRTEKKRIFLTDRELTRDAVKTFEVRDYKRKTTRIDKHEILGKVKRSERETFINSTGLNLGTNLDSFSSVLRVEHSEVVYLITHFGVTYGEVVLDNFHIFNYSMPNNFTLLRFQLNSNKLANLNYDEKNFLRKVFCRAEYDFNQLFPNIKPFEFFGYKEYTSLANQILPSRPFFERNPLAFKLLQALLFIIIGVLLLYLMFGRYRKNNGNRVIIKRTKH